MTGRAPCGRLAAALVPRLTVGVFNPNTFLGSRVHEVSETLKGVHVLGVPGTRVRAQADATHF
eukprot:8475147-Alexandrium_andersonii.AAC.1